MFETVFEKRDEKEWGNRLLSNGSQHFKINPDLATLAKAFEVYIILQVANFFAQ